MLQSMDKPFQLVTIAAQFDIENGEPLFQVYYEDSDFDNL
jgi:hypothetical protein